MNEPKKERIFLEMWYPETNTYGWLPFESSDIDFLIEKKIITLEALVDAITDLEAFEKAFSSTWTFEMSDIICLYLSFTDADIRIKA